jgi:hypothetical protein
MHPARFEHATSFEVISFSVGVEIERVIFIYSGGKLIEEYSTKTLPKKEL